MKKFIPLPIIWNGKHYQEGLLEEVPEDLAVAIDLMNGVSSETEAPSDEEVEEKPKTQTRRQAVVRTEI
jgi:fatty acid-binding protein DegV